MSRSAAGLLLIAVLTGLGCRSAPDRARVQPTYTTFRQDCSPAFAAQGHWYGADGVYSVPVSRGRSIWLFGDTLAADKIGLPDRIGTRLLSGMTVGVSDCGPDGGFSIGYRFAEEDGSRAMLFRPREPRFLDKKSPDYRYYWPLDAFLHGGKLHLALVEIGKADPDKPPDVMNFQPKGTLLATVPNYLEPVGKWDISYRRLSSGDLATPGGGIAVGGDYAYFYTYFNDVPGAAPRGLTRLPLATLGHGRPEERIEYLARDGRWKRGLPPSRKSALIVMADNATEMTVRYLPELRKWVALYNYADGFGTASLKNPVTPGDKVVYRLADGPEGPWSEPWELFRIDAKRLTGDRYDPTVFCYAAKMHPQFMRDGKIAVTYACNSTDFFGTLLKDMDVYMPQVRWVPLDDFRPR